MAIKTALFSALLALASVSGLLLSPEPLTHNQAVMFCATNGVRLADVTSASIEQVKHDLKGQAAWIGSWDYNFYNNACLEFVNGHIGAARCEDRLVAACNSPVVLKSMLQEQYGLVEEGEKSGARASRRPHPKPCDSSSSSSLSSGSSCAAECAYEYVYLTNTVTKVFTSVSSVYTITSTSTNYVYTATVAAYTITPPPLP